MPNRLHSSILGLSLSSLLACSTDSGPASPVPCNYDPWECPTGQTCWPQNDGDFVCLAAGPGQGGDACLDTAGRPTCGSGLACLQTGSTPGVCVAYCDSNDPSHGCPAGQTCDPAMLFATGNATLSICAAPMTGVDGGSAAVNDR